MNSKSLKKYRAKILANYSSFLELKEFLGMDEYASFVTCLRYNRVIRTLSLLYRIVSLKV